MPASMNGAIQAISRQFTLARTRLPSAVNAVKSRSSCSGTTKGSGKRFAIRGAATIPEPNPVSPKIV